MKHVSTWPHSQTGDDVFLNKRRGEREFSSQKAKVSWDELPLAKLQSTKTILELGTKPGQIVYTKIS